MNDRHEKWVRVEPGHVIPAGQPYRVETKSLRDWTVPDPTTPNDPELDVQVLVDSSWRPPLNLPISWAWGIAIHARFGAAVGRWSVLANGASFGTVDGEHKWDKSEVTDFVLLADEQIKRIEAAR